MNTLLESWKNGGFIHDRPSVSHVIPAIMLSSQLMVHVFFDDQSEIVQMHVSTMYCSPRLAKTCDSYNVLEETGEGEKGEEGETVFHRMMRHVVVLTDTEVPSSGSISMTVVKHRVSQNIFMIRFVVRRDANEKSDRYLNTQWVHVNRNELLF